MADEVKDMPVEPAVVPPEPKWWDAYVEAHRAKREPAKIAEDDARRNMVALAYLLARFPEIDVSHLESDQIHRDMMADARRHAAEFIAMSDGMAAPAPVAKPPEVKPPVVEPSKPAAPVPVMMPPAPMPTTPGFTATNAQGAQQTISSPTTLSVKE